MFDVIFCRENFVVAKTFKIRQFPGQFASSWGINAWCLSYNRNTEIFVENLTLQIQVVSGSTSPLVCLSNSHQETSITQTIFGRQLIYTEKDTVLLMRIEICFVL